MFIVGLAAGIWFGAAAGVFLMCIINMGKGA
jgi:hypothetical protein